VVGCSQNSLTRENEANQGGYPQVRRVAPTLAPQAVLAIPVAGASLSDRPSHLLRAELVRELLRPSPHLITAFLDDVGRADFRAHSRRGSWRAHRADQLRSQLPSGHHGGQAGREERDVRGRSAQPYPGPAPERTGRRTALPRRPRRAPISHESRRAVSVSAKTAASGGRGRRSRSTGPTRPIAPTGCPR
jgi:hypothetical protein